MDKKTRKIGKDLIQIQLANELTERLGSQLLNIGGEINMRSIPPIGYHKIYNLYAKKIGEGKYNLMADIETEPAT